MKEILKLSYGSSRDNFDEIVEINSLKAHVRGIGADNNLELAIKLIHKYKDECDVIAISGFPSDIKIKKKTYTHYMVDELRKAAGECPIIDGNNLRRAVFPWALKNYIDTDKHFLFNKKVAFYNGLVQWSCLPFFDEYSCKMVFGDMFFFMGLPLPIKSIQALENFLKFNSVLLTNTPLKKKTIRDFSSNRARLNTMKSFMDADIFVVNESQLKFIELNDLTGKTVIIDRCCLETSEKIFKAGAKKIINLFPALAEQPNVGSSVIESILLSHHPERIFSEEDILHYLEKAVIKPIVMFNPYIENQIERFAFIIHPLSKNQIAQIPGVEFLKETPLMNIAEIIASKLPGFHYCHVKGIKSTFNGKEVIGDLYLIPSTPKMLLTTPVEKVYNALVDICHMAHARGAKIIGLGAYTKIVGDAGVTVNSRSPIPLTTGNSLSSASTLWAASYGIEKLGLVKKVENQYDGTCIVIGATGSIGKICAKILSKQWKRIIVVAPRPYKVLELVNQLKELAPKTEIIGSTNPNKYSHEADLIITSTSAQGERILDIELVKPGCVICDVSRPFDISLDDAAKRPDILIIASGEVELPGNVKIGKTIGLQGETVYACLAETAVLAMEGIHESFSLSRDLSYERVVQIDRLSRKHGIKLSAIMGHTGEIKEHDIDLCKQFALKKLK